MPSNDPMPLNSVLLKQLHTFALSASASHVVFAETNEQIISAWQHANQHDQPFLLLGEGSNVLFIEDFTGTIVFNRIKGISINETDSCWHAHVGAGENWHYLVSSLLEQGIVGLENLALIPGCVGSSPIQNIGAYGVELNKVCSYVDLLDLTTGRITRISASACEFGYRDSIFKYQYREGYAIIAVGFELTKDWQPTLSYGELKLLDKESVTAKQIFDTICQMRKAKLPDPKVTGNAGSFFKNPIVDQTIADNILSRYPDAPVYRQHDNSLKLAAGWLIDLCGLKGYQIGGAAVHQNQALVIINQDNATAQDIMDLSYYIRLTVAEVFNVWLEPEVRFIGAYGEVDAVESLS